MSMKNSNDTIGNRTRDLQVTNFSIWKFKFRITNQYIVFPLMLLVL